MRKPGFPPIAARGISPDDARLIEQKLGPAVQTKLRGKRIFVTGGTGFVGCWLLEALVGASNHLDLDIKLEVLTRRPDAFHDKAPHLASDKAVHLVRGDVADLSSIYGRFDAVIHAATDVAKSESDPETAYQAIVEGTRQALDLAVRCGAQRFLYLSSGAVYGRQPATMDRIPESHQGSPDLRDTATAYGQAKRASEWLVTCRARKSGLEAVIARLFALIGPYLPLDSHFAAAQFVRDALDGKPMKMSGGGGALRSYLYGADMAVWLITLLAEGHPGEIYNVGSELPVTIKELAMAISKAAYGQARVIAGNASSMSLGGGDRYVPDTSLARVSHGLDQYTDLPSALAKTFEWAARQRGASSSISSGAPDARI